MELSIIDYQLLTRLLQIFGGYFGDKCRFSEVFVFAKLPQH